MKKMNEWAAKAFYYQRYMGLFLVIIGIPLFFIPGKNSEFPLMVGLFTLFTSMEKVEDERSVSLKTSSMYIAFIFGYTIKVSTASLFQLQLISFQLTEINHFIILIFAIAIACYFLRMYGSRNNPA